MPLLTKRLFLQQKGILKSNSCVSSLAR